MHALKILGQPRTGLEVVLRSNLSGRVSPPQMHALKILGQQRTGLPLKRIVC
jgi:hypothetical protein